MHNQEPIESISSNIQRKQAYHEPIENGDELKKKCDWQQNKNKKREKKSNE